KSGPVRCFRALTGPLSGYPFLAIPFWLSLFGHPFLATPFWLPLRRRRRRRKIALGLHLAQLLQQLGRVFENQNCRSTVVPAGAPKRGIHRRPAFRIREVDLRAVLDEILDDVVPSPE